MSDTTMRYPLSNDSGAAAKVTIAAGRDLDDRPVVHWRFTGAGGEAVHLVLSPADTRRACAEGYRLADLAEGVVLRTPAPYPTHLIPVAGERE